MLMRRGTAGSVYRGEPDAAAGTVGTSLAFNSVTIEDTVRPARMSDAHCLISFASPRSTFRAPAAAR